MRRRLHLFGWVLLGGCLIVAVFFVVRGTASLRNAAQEQTESTLAAEIAGDVKGLSALEWEARADRGVSRKLRANLLGTRGQIEQALNELSRNEGRDAYRDLDLYRVYVRASERELELLQAGKIAAAVRFGELSVDPSAAALTGFVVAQQHELQAAARRASTTARWRLEGSLVATGLLVALLAWQFVLQLRGRRRDRELLERLSELGRQKDEFVATVSHELRTPLTSIRGYAELLADDAELSSENNQWVRVIERNADRLYTLVADLLLMAEVTAGKFALQLDDVDISAAVAEAVEAARPAAENKDLTLTNHADVQISLRGDRARLGQVLDNLLGNAIKFTPAGGSVAIRTSQDQGAAVLEISDSGIGIAPADLERLFERFYRTDKAKGAAIQGSGLGLAISQTIITAHQGTIAVTSTPGTGTTFRLELPINHTATKHPVDHESTLSLAK
jgi:signal transduction histidine kinase